MNVVSGLRICVMPPLSAISLTVLTRLAGFPERILAGHRTDWADSSSVRRGPSVVSTFRSLPWPIQLAAVCLVAALGITLVVMALEPWNDRSRRTDARARHRAKAERRELRKARPEPDPSATPHDPHVARMDTHVRDADMTQTADQPELRVASERKLPGQDRLTRNPRTGMDVVPSAADDHLSGPTSRLQRSNPHPCAAVTPRLRPRAAQVRYTQPLALGRRMWHSPGTHRPPRCRWPCRSRRPRLRRRALSDASASKRSSSATPNADPLRAPRTKIRTPGGHRHTRKHPPEPQRLRRGTHRPIRAPLARPGTPGCR
jgi:hypothetical protein